MKHYHLVIFSFLLFYSHFVYSVQDVYQYTNKAGLVEFTDTLKKDQEPVNHFKFQKETAAEKTQREDKLKKIRQQSKELDKQLELREKLANEQKIRKQKEKEIENLKQQSLQHQQQENNNSNYDGGGWYYPVTYPSHYPNKPIYPRPKPVHPIEKTLPTLDPLAPARM